MSARGYALHSVRPQLSIFFFCLLYHRHLESSDFDVGDETCAAMKRWSRPRGLCSLTCRMWGIQVATNKRSFSLERNG